MHSFIYAILQCHSMRATPLVGHLTKLNMPMPVAVACVTLELVNGKDLVDIATMALMNGSNSLDLAFIAGEYDPTLELLPKFMQGLEADGVKIPNRDVAIDIILKFICEKHIDGSLSAKDCAFYIVDGLWKILMPESSAYVGDTWGIEKIYGLCDSYCEIDEWGPHWNTSKVEKEKIRMELMKDMSDAINVLYKKRWGLSRSP